MVESLRHRQRNLVRESILQALADEIVDNGLSKLSLQAVADRAGVSHRTLYNHFENREVLLHALVEDAHRAGIDEAPLHRPDDLDRIPDAIRHFFAAWAEQGAIARAGFQIEAADVAEGATRLDRPDEHIAALEGAVRAVRPDLDDDIRLAVVHVMRSLISGRTWHRLTAEHGIDSDLAADAAAWAFSVLAKTLRDGDGPDRSVRGG